MEAKTIKNNISDFINNHYKETINAPAMLFVKHDDKSKFGNIYIFQKFGISQADSIKLSSQITTHYMEDNVSAQDHWAIAPMTYTMSGLIGELIYQPPTKWSSFLEERFIDYLKPLSILSPTFDSYTQSAINAVQQIESSYRRYEQISKQIFQSYGQIPTRESNQEYVISALRQLRDNRQLVNVYTPYGTFNGLAIQDILATQNNSKYQSNLEIQFIEWRNAGKNKIREATEEDKASIAKYAKAQVEQQGQASTSKKSVFATRYDNNESLIQGIK